MKRIKQEKSGGHDTYFAQLNQLMREKGPGHPVLVLDLDLLDHNIDEMKTGIGDMSRFRLVVKSLPSADLVRYILERTQTRKLMVFHRPFLNIVNMTFPDTNILLGKPLPIQAMKTFFQEQCESYTLSKADNIQWLIDSEERLLQKTKPSWRTTLFIYGGYWKAAPFSPGRLVFNSLYGRSANQEMLNGPEETAIDVDDYVFLRPTQSESVILQFGDLFVVRGSQYLGRWPVFRQST